MQIAVWQIVVITLLAFIYRVDRLGTQIGMGALLTYMPAKQYFSFLAIGFVLSAYLGLSILPVAILGGAAAYEVYKNLTSRIAEESIATAEGGLEDE